LAGSILFSSSLARAFDNVTKGVMASFGFGTSAVGDTLMGEVGGDWLGLRVARDRHFVMQWDVYLALRGGYLGNQHPYLFLIGPHALSWFDAGWRFDSRKGFSPFIDARIGGDVSVLGNPDVPRLNEINAVDGVGGIAARGFARIGGGNAYVDDKRMVLLVVGAEEMLQAQQINTPSYAFTGGFLSLRVDVPRSVTATLEGGFDGAFARHDALRGTSDATTRAWIGASLRKILKNGMWLGGAVSYEQMMDHVVYEARQTTFDTADAPRFSVSLFVGVPIGGQR
jgi:hypothetical protein